MNILIQILTLTLAGLFAAFLIVSIVMFIKDGVDSKRESRPRKLKYVVMFTVSMTIIGTFVTIIALLYALTAIAMTSM